MLQSEITLPKNYSQQWSHWKSILGLYKQCSTVFQWRQYVAQLTLHVPKLAFNNLSYARIKKLYYFSHPLLIKYIYKDLSFKLYATLKMVLMSLGIIMLDKVEACMLFLVCKTNIHLSAMYTVETLEMCWYQILPWDGIIVYFQHLYCKQIFSHLRQVNSWLCDLSLQTLVYEISHSSMGMGNLKEKAFENLYHKYADKWYRHSIPLQVYGGRL